MFAVSRVLFVDRSTSCQAIRMIRSGNNRGSPHRPNNVKHAIESRVHYRDAIGYSGGADATGCNSRNFCVPAPSVSRALPRQAGPSRARGTQSEPFCSSNLKNVFFDVPRGESEVDPAGAGLSFGPRDSCKWEDNDRCVSIGSN